MQARDFSLKGFTLSNRGHRPRNKNNLHVTAWKAALQVSSYCLPGKVTYAHLLRPRALPPVSLSVGFQPTKLVTSTL